jgi:hypothetical protein
MKMHYHLSAHQLIPLITILGFCKLVTGLVTLRDIRSLTNLTRDCRDEVVNAKAFIVKVGVEQVIIGGNDEDEVEDVST